MWKNLLEESSWIVSLGTGELARGDVLDRLEKNGLRFRKRLMTSVVVGG